MRPLFLSLKHNYPHKDAIDTAQLFEGIGWDDLIDNPAYENTCAIRMSLALIRTGIHVSGRIAIKKGLHKGRWIEPGQAKLSRMLAAESMFGPPEKFDMQTVVSGIANRSGVISFVRIPSYLDGRGGHIDIIAPGAGGLMACGSGCYFTAHEYWFWELQG
ncbi:T6SS effector amidase Tae4 family protein [Pseudoduganella chitinolytica]|uniref:T6SS effector amidase Tae4 family protein n=1 Tax=Pseudoduganella chitinolytica TaxID=34070 RepID=A0ABY8BC74_9BURK|nr:T6SS effector amidase Tae4 family protein [Pseudoduganella chitinolytica]WEF33511.1 T6SS effector amidase Tae4 family protein [Pseudoduganella chitinolytica]